MSQKPTLGRIVLVKTYDADINGQSEHAAIVTQVWSEDCINVQVFPGAGPVLCMTSVRPPQPGQERGASWRWPPRD